MNASPLLSEITNKIPYLVTFDPDEKYPIKNESIIEFKDSTLDFGRLYFYLNSLPTKEKNKKLRKYSKMYPEMRFD